MPAAPIRINLIGKEDFAATPYGRIVTWAITYGRYIMIGTEIVVLLAFISRFSLDRKLTDLKEEISQKQAIIVANQSLEADVRNLQTRLAKIKTLLQTESKPIDLLGHIQSFLPADTYLGSFELTGDKLTVAVNSSTTDGFAQFLTNLQSDRQLTDITVGDVTKDPLKGIQFKFTARLVDKSTK